MTVLVMQGEAEFASCHQNITGAQEAQLAAEPDSVAAADRV
jgi:hypothetical protein